MFVLSKNNPAGRDNRAPAPAVKPNGENYPYRMFFNREEDIIDAEYPAECLEQLIPGYIALPEELQLDARLTLARAVQLTARATLLANLDPDTVEDWEWAVLTYENTDPEITDPYGWGDGQRDLGTEDLTQVDVWSNDTPLVLLETSYDPFTEIRRPVSTQGDFKYVPNIIWLEPAREEDFLRSLSRIGFIVFGSPRSDRN